MSLIGASETLTYALPLTTTGWQHGWQALPAWDAPTATLRLELSSSQSASVILDEISLGTAVVGSYPIYLPVLCRDSP